LVNDLASNPSITAEAFAVNAVNYYFARYDLRDNTTLAAIDLSKISAVADEVKNLHPLFNTAYKIATFEALVNNQLTAYNYLIQNYSSSDPTPRDLWDMADKIIEYMSGEADNDSITIECAAIKTAVERAVILSKYTLSGSGRSVAGSHGLAIYIPTPQTTTYESEYGDVDFNTYTGWGTFLQSLP
jgi:hypothetical protein